MTPTKLDLDKAERRLLIDWSDGSRRAYTIAELRDQCPCATCREKADADAQQEPDLLPIISPEEARPLEILGMQPMGSYAYSIEFSDGHDTGIYSLELLSEIGTEV